jgi:hypothetical protein
MTLRASDLRGARVTHAAYERDANDVARYEREFSAGRFGSSRLDDLNCDVELLASPNDGLGYFRAIRAAIGGPRGRAFLASAFRSAMSKSVPGAQVTSLTPVRTVAAGVPAFVIGANVRAQGLTVPLAIVVLRVDQVVESLTIVAVPGGALARELVPLTNLAASRIRRALGKP